MSSIVLLSKGLARYRHQYTECIASALPAELPVFSCNLGSNLWEVDWPALKAQNGRVQYRDFPNSLDELRSLNPSLLCTMEYSPSMLPPMFWAKNKRIPVVVFSDLGTHPPEQKQIPLLTRFQHRIFSHFTDAQVATAPAALTPHGARYRPILFAPHSVDTRDFPFRPALPRKDGPCRILYVAGYLYNKGHDLLCQVLRRILYTRNMDFELRLVGYSEPDWVRSVVEQHGLSSRTVITGIKKGRDLVEEFQNADLFVFPTRADTYGVVAQEAAATGLPILISCFAGASYNLVQDGENGYVIDPHDLDIFTDRLTSLMAHPERWTEMGKKSRAIAEQYCVRRMGINTADFLCKFLP